MKMVTASVSFILPQHSPLTLTPLALPLHIHSMDSNGHTLIHDAHTGQLVQAHARSSFSQEHAVDHLITLKEHWLCAGVAYIFYLSPAFSISTWIYQGSHVCFGSQSGEMLILDTSLAINKIGMM